MTKLDKEIQEGLYDPKKGKLTITGKKKAMQRLKKHLEKEHPSTKGKMFVYDPKKYLSDIGHGDMILREGLVIQKTFGESKSTGLKQDYKIYGKINSPSDIVKFVSDMENYDREYGKIIHLDTKNQVTGIETVSIGSLNAAVIHPREVFKKAILDNSASVIFIHNHPSGDPEPSREDKEITKVLIDSGKIIGIKVLDSVVIGRGKYYSFMESGDVKFLDPSPKRCEPSICKALESKGISCDTVDIKHEIDSTLSCDQNKKAILAQFGARARDRYSEYARQAKEHYAGQGKLINARPDVRAAAFARMREQGKLRGYDLKRFVVKWGKGERKTFDKLTEAAQYVKTLIKLGNTDAYFTHEGTAQKSFEKENKAKALAGKKLRGQQTLTSAVSTSRRLSEFGFDPKPKGKPSQWFDAMVAGIKRSSDVRNPYAIVRRIWDGLSSAKKSEILKREASGEVFKYDLPLPDDRDTKGIGTLRIVKPFKLAEAQVNVSAKDMEAVKKSGIFKPMKREDGSICQVARCKSKTPVNIFVDELK